MRGGQEAIATYHTVTIDSVVSMRDLIGVIIDSDLKFHSHVNSAVSKANQILSIVCPLLYNLSSHSSDVLPILYQSLVRPLLEYGNLIWVHFTFWIRDWRTFSRGLPT